MSKNVSVTDDMNFFNDLAKHEIEVRDEILFGETYPDILTPSEMFKYLKGIDFVNKYMWLVGVSVQVANDEFTAFWIENYDKITDAEAIKLIYRNFTTPEERKNPKTLSTLVNQFKYSTMYEFDDGSYLTNEDISLLGHEAAEKEQASKDAKELWESEDVENGKEE